MISTLTVFDASGAPLAGLTPTWHRLVNVATGAVYTPQPTITDQGEGRYVIEHTVVNEAHVAGLLDCGATADPRYSLFDFGDDDADYSVLAIYDADGDPLAGLTGTPDCVDADTGAAVVAPTVTDLGGGLYSIGTCAAAGQYVVGTIDFGATAEPQYYAYEDEGPAAPTATPEADAAVVSLLEPIAAVSGSYAALVEGQNLFAEPMPPEPDTNHPVKSVFVVQTSQTRDAVFVYERVQVTVRSDRNDYAGGLALIRACLAALHCPASMPSGWTDCQVPSGPYYVGAQKERRHVWALNVTLCRSLVSA